MKKYWIYVVLFQIFHKNLAAVPKTSREKEIKALESEKSELYKQINDAIDESVISLKKSNTSDAVLGITYIEDLKKQIKDLNGTESIDNVSYGKHEDMSIDDKSDLENRRSLIKNVLKKGDHTTKKAERRDLEGDIASAEKKKQKLEIRYLESMKDRSSKWRQKYESRLNIQQKLDAWIAERERERERIRLLKERMRNKFLSTKEKCPRNGKEKKKKSTRRRIKRRKKKKSGGKTYPCCRKCCKRSYMGCLRKK